MKAVKVLKKDTEKVRNKLIQLEAFDNSHKITRKDYYVLIPITKIPKGKFEIVDAELEKIVVPEKTLEEAIKGKLTDEEFKLLPKSFDTVGDIAIVEMPDELEKKEKLIAETLMKLHKHIKVVAKKASFYEGEFRTRKLKIIAGEKRKETVHKENNILLRLNAETCYFSPRLSTERKRIIDMVRPGETILVMFSGVGPYPISISKNTEAKEIIGIEINPDAHRYAEQNIILNKLKNVKAYQGDVRKIVPKLNMKFDRIIMPLPKTAEEFLPTALEASKKGTIIHLYDFSHEEDFPDSTISKVKMYVKKFKIMGVVRCGQYSPGKFRVCADFAVQ